MKRKIPKSLPDNVIDLIALASIARRAREEAKLEIGDLADISGLSKSTIYKVEAGTHSRSPLFGTVMKLALACGWTEGEFVQTYQTAKKVLPHAGLRVIPGGKKSFEGGLQQAWATGLVGMCREAVRS